LPSNSSTPPGALEAGEPRWARVVVETRSGPRGDGFDYAVPEGLRAGLQLGQRVRVPFGKRTLLGYVIDLPSEPAVPAPRPIEARLDEPPVLPPHLLALARWVAHHYAAPLPEVFRAMLPANIRRAPSRRKVGPRTVGVARARAQATGPPACPVVLDAAQQAAADRIGIAIGRHESHTFLLHGVAGSGKTEVYLAAIARALATGGSALMLVPELSLTPQTVARFAARFPGRLGLLHSGLTEAERALEWHRIRAGEAPIVIGSRSAVFAPLPNPRVIVVDEEDSSSYKQERLPRYHARDVARQLARESGACLILGSATPGVVTYWQAEHQATPILGLPEPYGGRRLPAIEVVDLRLELQAGNRRPLSRSLHQACQEALGAGRQVLLFLNRRGTATFVQCRDCGQPVECPNCSVSLVYHADRGELACHYCGTHRPLVRRCPRCGSARIKHMGLGTERLEAEVKQAFPAARVLRLDRDSVRARDRYYTIVEAFERGQADILVGTQLIAKGLQLPGVSVVGLINGDMSLHFPEYNAAERTFALVVQVAGRTSHSESPARVILQTYQPDHYAIACAQSYDYDGFYRQELALREAFRFPPFAPLITCVCAHRDEALALRTAKEYVQALSVTIETLRIQPLEILGPSPAFVQKVRGEFRFEVTLRGAGVERIYPYLPTGRMWSIDVDPA
jgi:primosomal protein N' (replication factor Y)